MSGASGGSTIDPYFRIHVSDRLLEIHDGPFLELGLKGIAGTLIDRPRRLEDRPDRAPAGASVRAIQESRIALRRMPSGFPSADTSKVLGLGATLTTLYCNSKKHLIGPVAK
jgi:hypothetical protein